MSDPEKPVREQAFKVSLIFKAARRSAALLGFAVLLLFLLLFCLSFPQKREEMTIYPRVPCAAA